MKLGIDPGHGGRKSGAVAGGIVEKDLVLQVCKDLQRASQQTGIAQAAVLTRVNDTDVPHWQRGQLTRGLDLVISVHANAATFQARGLMAFHWPGNSLGQQVAGQIQRSSPFPLASRAVKAPYSAGPRWPRVRYVLRHHRPTAVLVELGFLTNPDDARNLRDPRVRVELVACILTGVARAATILG